MSIMHCQFESTGRGRGCPDEPVMNFDFCIRHMNTPRGAQHALDRIRSERVVTQGDVDRTITAKTKLQSQDYQTSALEKMNEALDRILEWEHTVSILAGQLDPEDWRFTDRGGAEQIRSEITLYERAQDRTTKVLSQVSKMAIQEKLISLGKAQTELIIRIIMGVVGDLQLTEDQFDQARALVLERLEKEANLAPRVQYETKRELMSIEAEVISG